MSGVALKRDIHEYVLNLDIMVIINFIIYTKDTFQEPQQPRKQLYSLKLGDAQIKNLVMESLEKGTLKSTHADGTKVYTYNPKKYGISEMTTVFTEDNIIKTSYPVSGTSVIKK